MQKKGQASNSNQKIEIENEHIFASEKDNLRYLEDTVYAGLIDELPEEKYVIQDIKAIYISKEYIEEVSFNTRENNFFGYTLSDVERQLDGEKFIFTLDETGQTCIAEYKDFTETYNRMLNNVATGAGVILLCVTVSAVTGGVAPAMSVVFAASAKTGAVMALSGGAISGVVAGTIEGVQTKDWSKALLAGELAATEGFKIGAITGTLSGGINETIALKGATANGLTMNEVAVIQRESKYPLDMIREMHSFEEYEVYKDAGLTRGMINGRAALIREIDLDFESNLPNGETVTNLERMSRGYAPIDPNTGKYYQLHHVGQNAEGTLAILTEEEHQGNAMILNILDKESEIDRYAFDEVRKQFWMSYAAEI